LKRYVYVLTEEALGELLWSQPVPLEVLSREGETVLFASYEPLKDLKPLRVEEVSENWRNWKQGFGPVEIDDLVILPPWKKPIFIKPGVAFGTGLHPTTRLSVKLLKECLRRGDSVLDVGTGSGILAIVAKKLGAGKVLGIDISTEAVRECRENADLNNAAIECRLAEPSQIREVFDLLTANLEIAVFRKELSVLKSLFRREAVLSGIFGREELEELEALCERSGVKVDRIYEEENWFALKVRNDRD